MASSAIHNRVKEYYSFLLLLETGMIGVFVALFIRQLLRLSQAMGRPDVARMLTRAEGEHPARNRAA